MIDDALEVGTRPAKPPCQQRLTFLGTALESSAHLPELSLSGHRSRCSCLVGPHRPATRRCRRPSRRSPHRWTASAAATPCGGWSGTGRSRGSRTSSPVLSLNLYVFSAVICTGSPPGAFMVSHTGWALKDATPKARRAPASAIHPSGTRRRRRTRSRINPADHLREGPLRLSAAARVGAAADRAISNRVRLHPSTDRDVLPGSGSGMRRRRRTRALFHRTPQTRLPGNAVRSL